MSDELEALATSFEDAAARIGRDAEQVTSKGALNIKLSAQKRWRGSENLPRLWQSVGYDVSRVGSLVTAEIGPDTEKDYLQGALGGILEEGTIHNAPHPALAPALAEESPKYENYLGQAGQKLLDGR